MKLLNFLKSQGYSLIELLIAISILAITATIAVPSWQHLRKAQQTQAITRALITTLTYARQQAILRQQILLICPRSPKNVSRLCGEAWQNGWQVITPSHQLLREIASPSTLPITWKNLRHTQELYFSAQGTAEGSNGTFYYGNTQFIINRGGRYRIVTD